MSFVNVFELKSTKPYIHIAYACLIYYGSIHSQPSIMSKLTVLAGSYDVKNRANILCTCLIS